MTRLPTLTAGGLNINDGTTYRMQDGFDPGDDPKTWDEWVDYQGGVVQTNVKTKGLVEMTIPLKVYGATLYDLHVAIDAINTVVDTGAFDVVIDDGAFEITYSCRESKHVKYVADTVSVSQFRTSIDFKPMRDAAYVKVAHVPVVPVTGGPSI